jgi:hypothetical protein
VVHAGIHDWLSGLHQVVNVVHVVEVAVPGGAVLRHQSRLQGKTVHRLRHQRDTRYRAGQDLQVYIRPERLPDAPHAFERILPKVEQRGLEACTAAELEVPYADFRRTLHGRQEIIEPDLAAEDTLKTVSKRREHHADSPGALRKNHLTSSIPVTLVPG